MLSENEKKHKSRRYFMTNASSNLDKHKKLDQFTSYPASSDFASTRIRFFIINPCPQVEKLEFLEIQIDGANHRSCTRTEAEMVMILWTQIGQSHQ